MSIFQRIFHRTATGAEPAETGRTSGTSSSQPAEAGSGVVVTCQKCGHKHRKVITSGRATGGTFATCPKCGSGGIYDEFGQSFSPAQYAAEEIVRKYVKP